MRYVLFLLFGLVASLYGEEIDVVAEVSKGDHELFLRYRGAESWWDLGFTYDGDAVSPTLKISSEHILIGPLYGKGFYYTLYGESFAAWSSSYSERTRWTLSDSRNVGMLFRYEPLSLWFLPRDTDSSLGIALDIPFLDTFSLYFAHLLIGVSAKDSGWYGGYASPDGVFSRIYFALRYADRGWLASTRYGVEPSRLHPGGHELQCFLSRSGEHLDVNVLLLYRSPHFRAMPRGPESGWYFSSSLELRWGIFEFRTRLSYEKEIILDGETPEEDLLLVQDLEVLHHEAVDMRFKATLSVDRWFRHYEIDSELRVDHDVKGLDMRATLSASWDFDTESLNRQRYGVDLRLGDDTQIFSELAFYGEEDWHLGLELGFRVEQKKWWCAVRISHDELALSPYGRSQFLAAVEYRITVGLTLARIAQRASPDSDVMLDFYEEEEED